MVVYEIHLLHASHLQVNLGRLWCSFVFLDVHDVFDNWFDSIFNNKLKPTFSAKLRLHFSGSCMSFYNNIVEKKNVFGICEKFEMVLERLW